MELSLIVHAFVSTWKVSSSLAMKIICACQGPLFKTICNEKLNIKFDFLHNNLLLDNALEKYHVSILMNSNSFFTGY